ncbi:chemotaxis protein CheX [Paraburkholderia caballeronis]|uniref:chemotaxis protein CheX n=1 Tax=Paraburkholderia caballeronis TaxID=416943 RepID=UPI0010652BF2|nr:chemotaxis protein CheX [Paraburkholderia caballeronis]TDV03992.1 chemotaxis phosphatase CheX-like protein [Paraburkholderia caballeronis]TDV07085.1 chemotaxis phosphatase CheX-like protein [Paraburkholderia caballeronis]TDV17782.1 chemotaxis phosphatase CheX-like protein [Paraburkholderia caballeronis]
MSTSRLVSKILVLDARDDEMQSLSRLCDEHNLIGIAVRREDLSAALAEHTDLGAVLLAGDYGGSPADSAALAAQLGALRPELPVIVQRPGERESGELPAALRKLRASYAANDPESLRSVIDEHVFGLRFPDSLVSGIIEITTTRLSSLFPSLTVDTEPPSIVRDRIIFGEVFSLIPLEGSWCRGYMLMQAEEEPLLAMLGGVAAREREAGETGEANGTGEMSEADFRELNSVLGELTNLVWGAFKNRYLGEPLVAGSRPLVQVPLLVNHRHRYISFGSDNPQLRFRYRLSDVEAGRDVVIDQRFVFSLSWSPEDFDENDAADDALASGELDLF